MNTEPVTLAEWCHVAYENSKAHGWHDDPKDGTPERMPMRIALLHSEVSELLEAFRKDPNAPCDKPGLMLSRAAEELADIVIRLFDFVVEFKIDPEQVFADASFSSAQSQAQLYKDRDYPGDVGEWICALHKTVARLNVHTFDACAILFMQTAHFAVRHGYVLELAVKTKHTFNVTRPMMHGGKKF